MFTREYRYTVKAWYGSSGGAGITSEELKAKVVETIKDKADTENCIGLYLV